MCYKEPGKGWDTEAPPEMGLPDKSKQGAHPGPPWDRGLALFVAPLPQQLLLENTGS